MKVLLGTCLALVLAGAAPALSADDYSFAPQQGSATSTQDTGAAPQHRGRGAHRGGHARQFAAGDRVPQRLMSGRHVVSNYARFGVSAPGGGAQWVHAHGQLLLVGSDGVVRTATVFQRHGRHRRAAQDQSQPYSGSQDYGSQDQYQGQSDQSGDQSDDDQSDDQSQ